MIQKIKFNHIQGIVESMARLDPPTGKSPYKIGAKVRLNLALNFRRLQLVLDAIEEIRNKLIDEHALVRTPNPDGTASLSGDKFDDFSKAITAAVNQTTDVDLIQISAEELDLDNNQIPVGILAPMMETVIKI